MCLHCTSRKRIKMVRKRKTSRSNLNRTQEIAFTICHQVAICPSSGLRRTRCKTHDTGYVLYWRSTAKIQDLRYSSKVDREKYYGLLQFG